MFAVFHRGHCNDGVRVVWRRNHDRVEILLFVQQLTKIFVAFRLGILGEGVRCVLRIDIAEGNDVLTVASRPDRSHLGRRCRYRPD